MPLGLSSGTFELASVLLFALSVAAGLINRQYIIVLLKLNLGILETRVKHAQFLSGSVGNGMVQIPTGELLSQEQAKGLLDTVAKHLPGLIKTFNNKSAYASLAYIIRNWSLILGFISLVVSKVLAAYFLSSL